MAYPFLIASSLHSTMFLLKLHFDNYDVTPASTFTFHNVSIKTGL